MHLIIMRIFSSTFEYLLSTTAHDVATRSKMSWFSTTLGRYQDVSFIGFIKCIAHIILMILILSLNVKFLPAFGRDESTSWVVVNPSIHALIQPWHLCLVPRLLSICILNSLRKWITFWMMLRFTLISIVLLSVML